MKVGVDDADCRQCANAGVVDEVVDGPQVGGVPEQPERKGVGGELQVGLGPSVLTSEVVYSALEMATGEPAGSNAIQSAQPAEDGSRCGKPSGSSSS